MTMSRRIWLLRVVQRSGSTLRAKLLIVIRKFLNNFDKTWMNFNDFLIFRLIRGSNGLTTIQLLRQHQESISQHLANQQLQQQQSSPSSSPTSLSPPIHHLSLYKREHSDEDMPTDFSRPKNYDWANHRMLPFSCGLRTLSWMSK